jgi:peptide chain release factor 1
LKLSAQLVESFDTKTAKRAGELASIAGILQEWNKANEVRAYKVPELTAVDC